MGAECCAVLVQGQWQQAVEVFISAQMAGVAATQELCLAMLGVLEACNQPVPAAQLLQEYPQVRHSTLRKIPHPSDKDS